MAHKKAVAVKKPAKSSGKSTSKSKSSSKGKTPKGVAMLAIDIGPPPMMGPPPRRRPGMLPAGPLGVTRRTTPTPPGRALGLGGGRAGGMVPPGLTSRTAPVAPAATATGTSRRRVPGLTPAGPVGRRRRRVRYY